MEHSITVKQEHGKDSIVEIREDIQDSYPTPIRILSFYTNQSLVSNSGRAWNVRKAIEEYCREHGYRPWEETQHEIKAVYNAQDHSHHALDSLRKNIRENPQYQSALKDGKFRASKVQDTYGPAIAQLNEMIHALKAQVREKMAEIAADVTDAQAQAITGVQRPPHLLDRDYELLFRPLFQPEFDHYARYPKLEDMSAEQILDLFSM